jgi:hypothetical protein
VVRAPLALFKHQNGNEFFEFIPVGLSRLILTEAKPRPLLSYNRPTTVPLLLNYFPQLSHNSSFYVTII